MNQHTAFFAGLTLNAGYSSHVGLHRELNEDSLLVTDTLYAVADGMGGHESGEMASQLCVQHLHQLAETTEGLITATTLQQTLSDADAAIYREGQGKAGTTVSGAVVLQENGQPYWLVFNVGDSRTYRLRDGEFKQLTRDHSQVQEMVEAGYITEEDAHHHPRRHVITRALGAGAANQADFYMYPLEHGDRLLICSDGLSGEVPESTIITALTEQCRPVDAVTDLVALALRYGGRDNISAIVLDAAQEAQPAQP